MQWLGGDINLGRGLIGASAAIASVLPDHTWEYLAYREEFTMVHTPSCQSGQSLHCR